MGSLSHNLVLQHFSDHHAAAGPAVRRAPTMPANPAAADWPVSDTIVWEKLAKTFVLIRGS